MMQLFETKAPMSENLMKIEAMIEDEDNFHLVYEFKEEKNYTV